MSDSIFVQMLQGQLDKQVSKNDKLKDEIRFWSYCLWQGMQQYCPEEKERLRKFLGEELKISPYDHEPKKEVK